ncbi:DUF4870 domain-containing protein [Lipingzhangella sp. LS1_29]|uniref:DUF4870 domain-containing protein n=1 Tax=Lipingzhangella rawalii TaxID=2055835 RepID=A0ABU2H799_9ACTN|nr:DUF4870 domain-containing protein [Lipingzhangella rawalii]MDS1271176.1 DUF4870 domain-containing protein [Lipingzhangella rawalii]
MGYPQNDGEQWQQPNQPPGWDQYGQNTGGQAPGYPQGHQHPSGGQYPQGGQYPTGGQAGYWGYPDPNQAGMSPYQAGQWQAGGYQAGQGHPGGPQNSDEPMMGLFCHLGGLLLGFVVPLILYLVKKDESPFIRHHAAEALNFQITVLIGYLVSLVLMLVLIGLLTFFVVLVVDIIFCILAALAANRGEWYRYPVNIRMVS